MTLPTTRNRTYNPTDPVNSNDLNDLQDCVVGAKHPQMEINIPASSFRGDSTALGQYNQLGYVTGFGAAGKVVAELRAPVGTRIVSVVQYYDINGTASTLTPRLMRQNHASGAQNPVVSGSGDNTGTGIESQTLGANHVVLTGEAYFLEVTVAVANHRVHGAKVLLDRL